VWELATWVWFRIPQNIPNVRARWVAKTAAIFYHSKFETKTPWLRCRSGTFSRLFWSNGCCVLHKIQSGILQSMYASSFPDLLAILAKRIQLRNSLDWAHACPLFNSAHASVTTSSPGRETFFYALLGARQLFQETFSPAPFRSWEIVTHLSY